MLLVNRMRYRDPVSRLRFAWLIKQFKNFEVLYICEMKPISKIDTNVK